MVSTNSTTPDLHFIPQNLNCFDLEEERQLFAKSKEVIMALISSIAPLIVYVDTDLGNGLRGIHVAKAESGPELAYARGGKWFYRRTAKDKWGEGNDNSWMYFYFDEVSAGFQTAFTEALRKKQEHLDAVKKRKEMLDAILAVIKPN